MCAGTSGPRRRPPRLAAAPHPKNATTAEKPTPFKSNVWRLKPLYEGRQEGAAEFARGRHNTQARPQTNHEAREGRWQLKEARPAGATPGTHLCSGGKPVAKKNVQGGYGTYIRSSPTLGEEGGASTRHHFPSLPRANSIRHRFGRHPLPLLLGDRGRCALSPLKSAHLLAHAPLDPDDGESPPWAGSSLAPAFSSSRGWRVQGPGSQGSEGPEGPPSQPENPQGFQLGGRDPDECALGLAFWLVPVRARCFYRSPSHTFTPYALLNGEKNNPAFHIKQQNGPRVFQEQIKTAGLSLLCPRKKGKLKKCASKAIPDCKQVFPNVWDCSWSLFPERKD
ncbi:uncharacterized protein LOC119874198 isoform X3 [Canis lupus familiaris]|uniref:uncharacterized protein LOC119874198 isoform X3 n=1 Tax=Canis lupus familiaris TaxID=9615 RepID=UPI0015F155DD|nr:uncharacterized protein LOC119874198 isoform X3 [Canis lupus familiaris]